MNINFEGDGILKDFPREKVIHLTNPITVTSLKGGMESGKPSVAFIFDLPDGRKVLAETSGELFIAAARAMKTRYPELEG